MKYFLYCLQHYADFNGRARRSEYWYFVLFNFIISFVIGFTFGVIAGILDMPALDNLTYLWSLLCLSLVWQFLFVVCTTLVAVVGGCSFH